MNVHINTYCADRSTDGNVLMHLFPTVSTILYTLFCNFSWSFLYQYIKYFPVIIFKNLKYSTVWMYHNLFHWLIFN